MLKGIFVSLQHFPHRVQLKCVTTSVSSIMEPAGSSDWLLALRRLAPPRNEPQEADADGEIQHPPPELPGGVAFCRFTVRCGGLQCSLEALVHGCFGYLEINRGRTGECEVLGLQGIAAVGFGGGRVRGAPQYHRHRGIAHRCVVDHAAEMNSHPIAAHQPNRQQIGGARFDPRRRRRFPRCRRFCCCRRFCRYRAERSGRNGRSDERASLDELRCLSQSKKPQIPTAVPTTAASTPKMGKKLFRARKYREQSTRPSSSSPSPTSYLRARASSTSLSSSFALASCWIFSASAANLVRDASSFCTAASSLAGSVPRVCSRVTATSLSYSRIFFAW